PVRPDWMRGRVAPATRAATLFTGRVALDGHVDGCPGGRLDERQLHGYVGIVAPASTGGALRVGLLRLRAALTAMAIVDAPRGGITQHAIRFDDLLEQGPGIAVPQVDVRRVPPGQALIRALDLRGRGADGNLEDRVVVTRHVASVL